jgi:hypothetical protein
VPAQLSSRHSRSSKHHRRTRISSSNNRRSNNSNNRPRSSSDSPQWMLARENAHKFRSACVSPALFKFAPLCENRRWDAGATMIICSEDFLGLR